MSRCSRAPPERTKTDLEKYNRGGWWLIGAYGHIEFPKNRPWKIGKGIGCIGGPALCDMPCGIVDVGLDLFVLIDHEDCTPDETGPPGYPGGSVSSIDPDPDPDPPYPEDGDDDDDGEKTGDPEKKTATKEAESTETPQDSTIISETKSSRSYREKSTKTSQDSTIMSRSSSSVSYEETTTETSQNSTITSRSRSSTSYEKTKTKTSQDSTITSRPRSKASSSKISSASQVSSSSASAIEYMIVAAVGADQTNIQQTLQEFDPEKGGSYEPDVGNTSVSGGTWVYYELAPYEAEQLSSRSDILGVVTCASVVSMFGAGSSPSAPPQTVDATVSLETWTPPSSATLSASIVPERRRDNVGFKDGSGLLPNAIRRKTKFADGLEKRDPGTRLVRQRRTLVSYLFTPIIATFVMFLGLGIFSSFRDMSSDLEPLNVEKC